MVKKKNSRSIKNRAMKVDGYREFIRGIKTKIRSAQLKAVVSVNRELIRLYWEIGRDITQKQEQEGWGAKIIEKMAMGTQRSY